MTPPRALRRPPRRAPRLLAAVVTAAAVLAGVLAPTSAIAAPEPSPTPTPTSTLAIEPGTTSFTLSPLANGVVRPGNALSVSISLQNATDTEVPSTPVTLSLGTAPLADRESLRAWLDGSAARGIEPIATDALGAVAPDSSQVLGITVPADAPALVGRAPGVYPLVASYESPSGTVSSASAMIVPAEAGAEVGIGVVVPITAGPLGEGLLTAEQLTELTAPDGSLTAQLDAIADTDAILAVDPAIAAAIRVLGTAAPDAAKEWLARLESLPNSRFALQFGDADVTTQLEAGLPQPLEPTSFTAYMDPADFVSPTPTPTPTPTATPSSGTAENSALPGRKELLSIGADARPGMYWPADGTADTGIVTTLAGMPVDGIAPLSVVPSATTLAGAAGSTVPAHGRVGNAGVLVYDSDVSTALDEASVSTESWLRGAPLTAATAYLAFAAADAAGPLLVTIGRGDGRSRVDLDAAISAAFFAPGVTPRSLDALTAAEPVEVELADVGESAERVAVASGLFAGEGEITRFATILDEPSMLTGPERADILQLLGVAWIGDDEWSTAIESHREQTAETLDSVALLPTSPSDLYGSSAALRFWVRNDLAYPVNLVLYTTRDNLRLDVQSETTVVATPQSNTRIEVPVQARVGRGDVTLTLQLRSPAFVAIGSPETVEVNVMADWEGVGIVALAVLVGGLLVIGIVRTVLRIRRRRTERDASAPPATEATGSDTAEPDAGGSSGSTTAAPDAGPGDAAEEETSQ